jgi:hypothetical protein
VNLALSRNGKIGGARSKRTEDEAKNIGDTKRGDTKRVKTRVTKRIFIDAR